MAEMVRLETAQKYLDRALAAEATIERVRVALDTKFWIPSQYEEDALVYADRIQEALDG